MAVRPGSKIGPYEIVGLIGAGGMGEVYRARDARLGRDVAVKLLPASFSSDHDRLQRFALEARAAAALNHSNILSIFDIGEEGGAPYVVSELLEGDTLRQKLQSGPLNLRKATESAIQMASGLAAAHEKGIVHRDLKPENLFLTADGRLKILDFGLAKLTRPENTSPDAATVQVATDPGTVMGTVGYMSPEQVRGKNADHRSDIFAFGAILYEMLSGKRAFHGDTPADTMSAILKDDPPDLAETNRNVPPALERIVRHCLEKNPQQRFQSAGDIAFDLESLTGISSGSKSATALAPARSSPRYLLPALLTLAALAAIAGAYWIGSRRARTEATVFHRLSFRRGTIWSARFASDGQNIVYSAAWEGKPMEIFSGRYDSTEARSLGQSNASVLSVSSKGEMALATDLRGVSPFVAIGTLSRMPLAGGAPRQMMRDIPWADWAPDGDGLAAVHEVGPSNLVLEFPLGKLIYQPVGWVSHVRFSPQGSDIAFLDHVPGGDDGRAVIVDRSGNHLAQSSFFTTVEGLAWSPSGDEVWFTGAPNGTARAIYALSPSGKQRLVLRVPGTLTLQDVTRQGRVLMTEENVRMGLTVEDAKGVQEDASWLDWSLLQGLSADGPTLLFTETGEGVSGNYGVYLRKVGAPAIRLGDGGFAVLSPDGKLVAALESSRQIAILPTGAGERKLLTQTSNVAFLDWTPDGKQIVYAARPPGSLIRSYVADIASGQVRALAEPGIAGTLVSPDGRWVVTGRGLDLFFKTPIDGGPSLPIRGLNRDLYPIAWTPDANHLLVVGQGVPAPVYRVDIVSGETQLVRTIGPADMAGVQVVSQVLNRDKVWAFSYLRTLSDLYVAEGVH